MLPLGQNSQQLFKPESNAAFAKVIRCHFHIDPITGQNPDTVFAHFTAGMSQHFMIIVELHAKHRIWQKLCNCSRELYYTFLGHVILSIYRFGDIDMRKFRQKVKFLL
jgi:hypothetical protein